MAETIVITGGAGFSGSYRYERQLADGLGRTIEWFRERAG
jgi:hypothetical protein